MIPATENKCRRFKQFNSAELRRMQGILNGIKRTTGQHPGGIMIFPKEKNIYEFTPLQHPADDIKADVITTHFSYKGEVIPGGAGKWDYTARRAKMHPPVHGGVHSNCKCTGEGVVKNLSGSLVV